MNHYHQLYLCLLVIGSSLQLQADEQTAFWKGTDADGAERLWMTRHNGTVGTAHALGAKPTVLHAQFAHDAALGAWEATFAQDTRLPTSPWWSADNELEATPTEHGDFYFTQSPQPKLEIQIGTRRTPYQQVASLQKETQRYSLEIYNCEQTVHKLQFDDPIYRTIEIELAALTQSEIEKARTHWTKQYEENGEVLITPRREIEVEQRLLSLNPDRCALLLITRTYSGGARSQSRLLALNYFLTAEGRWQRHIPLTRHPAPDQIKAKIRDTLNHIKSDGDYFYREETDPLDPATRMFQVLQIGPTPWAIFAPYAVAPGAFGSISVPIQL